MKLLLSSLAVILQLQSAAGNFLRQRVLTQEITCGSKVCPGGQECCNPSCGICVLPGFPCPAMICHEDPVPVPLPVAEEEGEACGPATCSSDEVCCNPSCGICVPRDGNQGCIKLQCHDPIITQPIPHQIGGAGIPCGPNYCSDGEECCNESCGICTPIGRGCTKQLCPPESELLPVGSSSTTPEHLPADIPCGPNTCGAGEECCNESCGICTPIGGGCTKQLCPPKTDFLPAAKQAPGVQLPAGVQCGPSTCGADEECCNESCGICTPIGGGCTKQFCPPTPEHFPATSQQDDPAQLPARVQCGPNTCPQGEECCNESCGICTPPGGMCTLQFCEPQQP